MQSITVIRRRKKTLVYLCSELNFTVYTPDILFGKYMYIYPTNLSLLHQTPVTISLYKRL